MAAQDDSSKAICDDELFLEIIKESMAPHDEVGPFLGLKRVDLDNIRRDHSAEKTRKLKVLEEWRNQQGSKATRKALADVFCKMEDNLTVHFIARFIEQYDQIHRTTMHHESSVDEVSPERGQNYPSWNEMERDEKVKTKRALIKENFKVKRAYALSLTKICNAVISDNASTSDIKIALISYAGKIIPDLKLATTIPELFLIIAENTSWFNYNLVELVLEACNSQKGRTLLSEYKSDVLKPYLKRSIFEVPAESFPCFAGSSSYVLCAKIVDDKIDLSGEEVMEIHDELAELLQIPSLQLMRYDDGSIRLIFGIHWKIFQHEMRRENSTLCKYMKWNGEKEVYVITETSSTFEYETSGSHLVHRKVISEKHKEKESLQLLTISDTEYVGKRRQPLHAQDVKSAPKTYILLLVSMPIIIGMIIMVIMTVFHNNDQQQYSLIKKLKERLAVEERLAMAMEERLERLAMAMEERLERLAMYREYEIDRAYQKLEEREIIFDKALADVERQLMECRLTSLQMHAGTNDDDEEQGTEIK